MKHHSLTLVVGAALVLVGAVGSTEPLTSFAFVADTQSLVLQIDRLEGIVRSINDLLEAVLDLVRTLRALFGGGSD